MPKAMARHILVKTEAEAAQLKKRLANGEAFDVLARIRPARPGRKAATSAKCALGRWCAASIR